MSTTRHRPNPMTCNSLGCALLGIGLVLTAGCTEKINPAVDGGTSDAASEASTADGGDAGKTASIACYISGQFSCEEIISPTPAEEDNLRVVCSSGSGEPKTPAACPPAGFLGKCTFTADGTTRTRRYYTGPGVDAAYQQDFCVNTAHGMWSTTF